MQTLLLIAALASAAGEQSRREDPALRGKNLYARMCAVCHGASGEGYRADNAPAIGSPGYLATVTDEFLSNAIADGRAGTTMSAWSSRRAGPLSPSAVDAVVAYLRTFEAGERVALDERPAAGNPVHGKTLYAANCRKCHGQDGRDGTAVAIGNPALLKDASDGLLRHAIAEGRGEFMPGFKTELGNAGIDDLIAWLRVLQSSRAIAEPVLAAPAAPLPLGTCPIHLGGVEPKGFKAYPEMVSVDLVKAQADRKAKMCLLDARVQSDYLNEHIHGAVSVPFFDPVPYLAALPKDTWLIAYCACPHASSGQLAKRLQAAGFKKVSVLDEGILDWKKKNYGVRGGPDP